MDHDLSFGLEIDCLVQADLFLEMRSKLRLVTGTLEEANSLTLGYGHRVSGKEEAGNESNSDMCLSPGNPYLDLYKPA
ncbi:hypothetical protein N7494_002397 [Penicillium frequentans]|uniref:Uncharacterized protein n=1 Tax=Penicillium frequentans TaxID=3151616 RepID=A0AAD6D3V5_9EURO|nr:hypothetical protein N7494_002397 [Penicillium glabrum]